MRSAISTRLTTAMRRIAGDSVHLPSEAGLAGVWLAAARAGRTAPVTGTGRWVFAALRAAADMITCIGRRLPTRLRRAPSGHVIAGTRGPVGEPIDCIEDVGHRGALEAERGPDQGGGVIKAAVLLAGSLRRPTFAIRRTGLITMCMLASGAISTLHDVTPIW